MNCFQDPCSEKICPHLDATCVSNYCGGCNAVWYDQTGQNILDCTGKNKHEYFKCSSSISNSKILAVPDTPNAHRLFSMFCE